MKLIMIFVKYQVVILDVMIGGFNIIYNYIGISLYCHGVDASVITTRKLDIHIWMKHSLIM